MKSQKVTFKKSQKLLAENLHERPSIQNIYSYSNSFNFKGGLCNCLTGYCPYRAPCPGGEQFLWFFENDLPAISPYFILFWLKQT